MLRVTFLLVALFLTSISQVRVEAHENEPGAYMSYPRECCGSNQCSPVQKVERVGAGLWLHLADGSYHLVRAEDKRRPSADGRWHLGVSTDHETQTKVVSCIFEPKN